MGLDRSLVKSGLQPLDHRALIRTRLPMETGNGRWPSHMISTEAKSCGEIASTESPLFLLNMAKLQSGTVAGTCDYLHHDVCKEHYLHIDFVLQDCFGLQILHDTATPSTLKIAIRHSCCSLHHDGCGNLAGAFHLLQFQFALLCLTSITLCVV